MSRGVSETETLPFEVAQGRGVSSRIYVEGTATPRVGALTQLALLGTGTEVGNLFQAKATFPTF